MDSPCAPSCPIFDPRSNCQYSTLDLSYQTFVQAYWEYRVRAANKNDDWDLFYGCFHPKKKVDEDKQFEPVFPYDVPWLNNMQAYATYEASKDLEPDDPSYWDQKRLKAATSGSDLERRMATTDWDWYWYNKKLREGTEIKLSTARAKAELDKIMFELFDDDYEDDGSYKIEKNNKYYVQLRNLHQKLEKYIDFNIDFV